jgi:hypothetical protein
MRNILIGRHKNRVILAVGVALGLTLALAPVAPIGAGAAVGQAGSMVFWNRFEHQTNPLTSELGPDVQLANYKYTDWQEAKIVPGRFGNGLFVNHGTDEGWNGDGANFFATDLSQTTLTPQAGTIEFWFTFKYSADTHNHAFFFDSRDVLAGHFTQPPSELVSGTALAAEWNGWDYGSYGKRFTFHLGDNMIMTPDYSAGPGGKYDFQPGTTMHFGYVWDAAGIAGSQDTMRIYVNGALGAAGQSALSAEPLTRYLYLGATPNYTPYWDSHYNAVLGVTDNLKIYDAARTNFTDRNQEMPWTLRGFKSPVLSAPAVNRVKAGATVPLKFEIFAGTREITNPTVVSSFTAARVNCTTAAVQSSGPITTAGGTKLRYDWRAGQFIESWKTPTKAGACYTVKMTTEVGASLSARFRLT